jgi:hypothetical protein
MRVMMTVTVPVEKGNAAVKDGSIGQLIGQTLERTKAEAAYFTVENGERKAFIFFEMHDSSEMPGIGEPLFQGLNARVQSTPCMNAAELKAGLEKLAKK